ncbi:MULTISPECIES: acyltransferase family protein [Butyribacter]
MNEGYNLESISRGRNNNLNLIRFIAALMVILGHSYVATTAGKEHEFMCIITQNQLDFGGLAVSIFFVYGGFLICKSMHRLENAKYYFKARIIRIFPPLIFVTFVMAFIVGPIVTELSIDSYFTSVGTYKYLLNSFMILVHDLPGVFLENMQTAVNGPLWTLPVEFLCYIACYIMYKMGLLDKKNAKYTVIPVVVIYIISYKILGVVPLLREALRPAVLFYVGMLYYVYREDIVIDLKGVLICSVLAMISVPLHIMRITIFLFLPYLMMALGYGTKRKIADFGKKAEISYGIYLFGWPAQQCIVKYFGVSMSAIHNFILASVIAILCGFITYYLIEQPMAKWSKGKS